MPVKKTTNVKKKAAKKSVATPAKRGPGRPKGSTSAKKSGPAKKAATTAKKSPGRPKGSGSKNVKNVKKPAGKRGGFHREINPDTGFVVGTDQDLIAQALLEGGESRGDIIAYLENTLDNETRNGTPKMITNMVSGVLNKMLAAGYTVESSFIVVPPTPASKRAANKKKK